MVSKHEEKSLIKYFMKTNFNINIIDQSIFKISIKDIIQIAAIV